MVALLSGLEGVDVVDDLRTPEQLTRDRVVVAVSAATPVDVACPWRTVELELWTVAAVTARGASVDAVDDLCDAVLDVLEAAGVAWSRVERGVWADAYDAYRIQCETRE